MEQQQNITPDEAVKGAGVQIALQEMENRIKALQFENDKLRKEKKNGIQYIERIVEQEPANYRKTMKENKKLQADNKKLMDVIRFGDVSYVDNQIRDYMEMSRERLRPLCARLQVGNCTRSNILQAIALIDYLDGVKRELYTFVSLHEEGRFIMNPDLRACQTDAKRICDFLTHPNHLLSVKEENLGELHQLLLHFCEMLQEFEQQQGKDGNTAQAQ